MLLLRDPSELQAVPDPEVRALLARRFVEIADGDDYDPDLYGYFLLLEAGDRIEEVEQVAGVSWHSALEGALHGWEVITEHPCCFEAVFVLDDTGRGVDGRRWWRRAWLLTRYTFL